MIGRLLIPLALAGCWSSSSGPPSQPTPSPAPAKPPSATPDDFNAMAEQPIAAAATSASSGSQVTIAANVNGEGVAAFSANNFGVASAKFIEAVARVPEPAYFFNVCLS